MTISELRIPKMVTNVNQNSKKFFCFRQLDVQLILNMGKQEKSLATWLVSMGESGTECDL